MYRLRIIILLLLLPCVASAQRNLVELTSGDLPYTASSNDSIVISGTITATGNGILIDRSNNIYIGGDGGMDDTLIYNTGGTSGAYGLKTKLGGYDGWSYNITVRQLVFVAGDSSQTSYGIFMNSTHDMSIDTCHFIAAGYNSQCVAGDPGGGVGNYRMNINGCHFWNVSDSFGSRMAYDGAAVKINRAFRDTPGLVSYTINPDTVAMDDWWHWKVRGCVVHRTPGQGIVIDGKSEIVQCTTYLDHHDIGQDHWVDSTRITALGGTVYDSIKDNNDVMGVGGGSANSYGIMFVYPMAGARCDSNYIRRHPDSLWRGGRGIMIENATGSYDQPVTVGWNDIDISEGWDAYVREGYAGFGIRVREESHGYGIRIHHNTVTMYTDNDGSHLTGAGDTTDLGEQRWDSSDAYKPQAQAIYVGFDYDSVNVLIDLDSMLDMPRTIIDSNTFTVISLDDSSYAIPMRIAQEWRTDTSNHIFGNTLISDGNAVLFDRAAGMLFESNTFHADSLAAADTSTWVIGADLRTDVEVLDINYTGSYADRDKNIYLDQGSEEGDVMQITLRRSLSIAVRGSNGLPVIGATVYVVNAYGNTVGTLTTDSGGMAYDTVNYWWEWKEVVTTDDSTAFNPFTLSAVMDADSVANSFTVEWDAYEDTITLSSTTGTGYWRPDPPNYVVVDSFRCDYSGDNDSVMVIVSVGAGNTGDSIITAVNVSSSITTADTTRQAVAMTTLDTLYFTITDGGVGPPSHAEPYTVYARAWTKTGDDSVYSESVLDSVRLHGVYPPRPTSVIVTDSIFYNVSGSDDSVRVLVVCPPDSGARNPDSIACAANFGISTPSFPNVNQQWQPYVANDTLEYWFTIAGGGSFTVTAGAKGYNGYWSQSTTSGSNSFDESAGVAAPSSVSLDSLSNDYDVGEEDQVLVTITTGGTTGDSLYYAVSATAYPDSSDVTEIGYTASTTVYDTLTVTGTEPYTAYLSVWVVEGGEYSSRSTASEYFGGEAAEPDEGTTIKIKADIKFKGEIKIK